MSLCFSHLLHGFPPFLFPSFPDFPWVFHGFSMGFPWVFHGFSMGFPWVFHGFSQIFPWFPRLFIPGSRSCWNFHSSSASRAWSCSGSHESSEALRQSRSRAMASKQVCCRSRWSYIYICIYHQYQYWYIYIYIDQYKYWYIYIYWWYRYTKGYGDGGSLYDQ